MVGYSTQKSNYYYHYAGDDNDDDGDSYLIMSAQAVKTGLHR